MKNKLNATNLITWKVIKAFTAFCLSVIIVVGGLLGKAADAAAEYEPTIAGFSIAVRYQTRAEFVSAGQPIYFEGTIYSRPDFFDRYNGLVFSASVGSRQGTTVRIARLQDGQVSPPRMIGGNDLQDAQQSNQTQVAVVPAPLSASNNASTVAEVEENNPVLGAEADTFNVPRLFSNEELRLLAENAPDHRYARSNIILPDRRLTDVELSQWIDEYFELGGFYAAELELVRLINIERENIGLQPLTLCPALMMAARFRAQGFGNLDYFSHTSPIYGSSLNFSRLFGFTGGVAEVIGRGGFGEAQEQFNRWSNSPSHRAIMMHPEAKYIGIGSAWVTTPRETTARVGMIGFCWADSDG